MLLRQEVPNRREPSSRLIGQSGMVTKDFGPHSGRSSLGKRKGVASSPTLPLTKDAPEIRQANRYRLTGTRSCIRGGKGNARHRTREQRRRHEYSLLPC